MDSAHINNAPTMLKLKGAKISGQSQVIEVTQIAEIEGAPGVDDVRKIAMPVPFNPPSQVLFELLGWLTNAAKGVVTTAEEKIAEITSNAPVGTTQAMIEQGAAVFSSIHARLHDSQKRVFKILARLNRWYVDEQQRGEVVADLAISKEDFETNADIVPVSDPHIFAESQRYAQIQALASRAQLNPDLYNRLAVEKRILKQIKLPDINEVLPDPADVKEMNPALENVSMTLGKPVGAFPSQDHIAHLLSHISYAQDPVFGSNPIVAPTFAPACIEHLKQHLTLWYLQTVDGYASQALGHNFDIMKIQPIMAEAQKMISVATQHAHMDAKENLEQQVMPTIQALLQTVQKMQQNKQPSDPNIMAQVDALKETAMAETQRKAQYDQAKTQLDSQKIQQQGAIEQQKLQFEATQATEKNLTEERIKSAELTRDAARLQNEQMQTVIDAQNKLQSNLGDKNV